MLLTESLEVARPVGIVVSKGIVQEVKVGANSDFVAGTVCSKREVQIVEMKAGERFLIEADFLGDFSFAAEENPIQPLHSVNPAAWRPEDRYFDFFGFWSVMDYLPVNIRRSRARPFPVAEMGCARDAQEIAMFQVAKKPLSEILAKDAHVIVRKNENFAAALGYSAVIPLAQPLCIGNVDDFKIAAREQIFVHSRNGREFVCVRTT